MVFVVFLNKVALIFEIFALCDYIMYVTNKTENSYGHV